ncbi:MAG: tRNA uridine-5-carboxymethylaminomethyl(34) synthesis GTPase MnmE [Rhizobiaceae bacterium]|nr:MAG: tRNA uridine-5-carboxymethylaminomethyl(34) synthesis GTPase MnmE [Rhizobiaceae bacterium]
MERRQLFFRDTIYALSSGRLPAGIAVLRLSGPHVPQVLQACTGALPQERVAAVRPIRTAGGDLIDRALVLFFAGPRSFTGEDMAEFHLHGGPAVVRAMLDLLRSREGLRQAEAGEFTRRAFLLGKVDLTGAEALGDLVAAETEAQRRFALSNAGGQQADLYLSWRERIIRARAMIEADLDFSDEGDVPGSVAEAIWSEVDALAGEVDAHIANFHRAEIIRDGLSVVIVGAPNAGKSSLLNALAKRDVAIVTDEPGTTRDLVEVALDLDGNKVILTDTAGIRDGAAPVEAIGIERALEKGRQADLVLLVADMTAEGRLTALFPGQKTFRVGTKSDLRRHTTPDLFDVEISSRTGEGIPFLLEMLSRWAAKEAGPAGDILPSRARHVEHLLRCRDCLKAAAHDAPRELELRAEDLREAGDSLGRIVGKIGAEDILDVVFSSFCIGK